MTTLILDAKHLNSKSQNHKHLANSSTASSTTFVRPSLGSHLEGQWQRQNSSVACDYRFVEPAIVAIDMYFSRYGQSLFSKDNSVIGSSGFSGSPLQPLDWQESKIPN